VNDLKFYKCHKTVHAAPMTLGEYYERMTMSLDDRDPDQEGYFIIYNKDSDDHYESWSPKHVFEDGYTEHQTLQNKPLNFEQALEELKAGRKVWREGWNGKGMWLILVPGTPKVRPVAGTPYSKAGITEETDINPHIDMYTADGNMQPGWLASQTDVLAEDWCSDRVY
jgi:hypothetical protein